MGRWILLVVAMLFATTEFASAQSSVFRTRRSASSVVWPIVIGGGIEYESDSDQTQYDFPLFLQYSFTERFQVSVETAFSHVLGSAPGVSNASGLDDLETTVEYEFFRERRYSPALTFLGGARWPTSTNSDIGAEEIGRAHV